GIQTLSASHGVTFDLNATGNASTARGWVGAGDGLLVMDRNKDGIINDGTELFGGATRLANGQRAGDGFTAMRAEDTNGDGKLTAEDASFADLKVWVDRNSNGITDEGELLDLSSLGIIELNLGAVAGTTMDNGNMLGLVADYKTADGATHEMADVWFAKDASVVAGTDPNALLEISDPGNAPPPMPGLLADTGANPAGAATGPAGATPPALGVSTGDLLADRGEDLLPPELTQVAAPEVIASGSVEANRLQLLHPDVTKLVKDEPNAPLI